MFDIGKSLPQNIILKMKMERTMQRPTALKLDCLFNETNLVLTLVQFFFFTNVCIQFWCWQTLLYFRSKRNKVKVKLHYIVEGEK